jgi:hypothetical protein
MGFTSRGLVRTLATITLAGSLWGGAAASTAHAASSAPSLLDAPVPATCGHAATRLDGYEKEYAATNGHTTLDVSQATTLRVGRRHVVTVVPLSCTSHGKHGPDLLLAYGPGTTLVGTVPMRTGPAAQTRATVSDLHREPDGIVGTLTTSTAGGYMRTVYDLGVGWSHGHLQTRHGAPLSIDGRPAGVRNPDGGPSMRSPSQSGRLRPAPAGLRSFLTDQWTPSTSSIALSRFTSRVNGLTPKNHNFALIIWSPGDEEADVAGKVDGTWRWVGSYWNRGQDLPQCSDLKGVSHQAWVALGLSCFEDGRTVTLGTWPSGA